MCRKLTYQSTFSSAKSVFFVPYESTAYSCARCHEQFAAWNEGLLYRSLKSTIQGKVCPTCQAPLREYLVAQGIPLLDRERTDFDAEMRAQGYDQVSTQEDVNAEYYDLFT